MNFVERKDKIKLPPIDERVFEKMHFSTRMSLFLDNEHTMWGSRYMNPMYRQEFDGIMQRDKMERDWEERKKHE